MRRQPRMMFPPTNCIAVDVDGTLHQGGVVNERVVDWCREQKAKGRTMILWSARGADYARRAAEIANVTDIFDVITAKPGAILDDQGWNWIRFTRVIRTLSE